MASVDDSRAELVVLLRQARDAKGLSIRAIARQVEVPAATAQGWLNGRHLPTPALRDNFRRMLALLEVEIDDSVWLNEVRPLNLTNQQRPPYLGLRPFLVSDRDLFYGRAGEARRLAEMIAARPDRTGLVALVGGSGSGKSSLLAAGLVASECVDGLLAGWSVVTMEPDALTTNIDTDLIVIDQFEAVLLGEDAELGSAMKIVDELARRSVVVLGMRSDAFAAAANQPVLAKALETPMLLSPMTDDELTEAIVQPAGLAGVKVEPELVTMLLSDVAPPDTERYSAGQVLPLLSNALLMTWLAAGGRAMTVASYVRTGGVASAVETLAEEVYQSLPSQQHTEVRDLFLRLVRLISDSVIRTEVPLDSLTASQREIAERFVAARLLTIRVDQLTISHDALLTNWKRLSDWVSAGHLDLHVREQLHRATMLWLYNDRSPDSLLPVDRLPLFTDFVADPDHAQGLSTAEREFVTQSQQHFDSLVDQERASAAKLRRRSQWAIILAVLATAAAVLTATVLYNSHNAQLAAESRQIAYSVRSDRTGDTFVQAQLAMVSASLSETVEGRSILLDSYANDVPQRWVGEGPSVIAVSPDDSLVLRADFVGQVTSWRGDELTSSPGHTWVANPAGEPLYTVDISQHGAQQLAAVGGAKYAAIWDVTGEPSMVAELEVGDATVFALAFSPAGDLLAVGDSTGRLRLISVADPARPQLLAEHTLANEISSIVFDPVRPVLYVGAVGGQIDVWSIADDGLKAQPALPYQPDESMRRAQSVAISPDGRWLVAGLAGRITVRWDLTAAEPTPVATTDYVSWVNTVRFIDNDTYVTADSGQQVRITEAATDKVLRLLTGPTLMTGAQMVGERPVAVDIAGTLRIWQPTGPVLKRGGNPVYQFATDKAGTKWLGYVDSAANQVVLWSLANGMHQAETPKMPAGIVLSNSVWINAEGTRLWVGTIDGKVISWPLTDQGAGEARIDQVIAEDETVVGLVVAPNSEYLIVSGHRSETTKLMAVDGAGVLTRIAELEALTPQMARFSADSQLLAIGLAKNEVRVWSLVDPSAPRQVAALPTDANAGSVAFSPVEQTLAVGSDAGTVALWDLSDAAAPEKLREYTQARAAISALQFSHDGERLMAAGGNQVFYSWQLADQTNMADLVLDGGIGSTTEIWFFDGGTRFAGAGRDGTVKLWDLDAERVKTQLCSHFGTPFSEEEWRNTIVGIEPFDPCK